ncbi:MAG: DUF4185 domain-containing protein [Prolixibacteraceae bacterium]
MQMKMYSGTLVVCLLVLLSFAAAGPSGGANRPPDGKDASGSAVVQPADKRNLVTGDGALRPDTSNFQFTVEEAPDWTALFNRTSGWFGADGIFAIPLNGKDNTPATDNTLTMLLFSDTMIGEINNDSLQPGSVMVNNTVAYLRGPEPKENQISFHWAKDSTGKPVALFVPETAQAAKGDYYWLGDGFVNTERANTTYIFAYRMRKLDANDDWSFKEMETVLLALPAKSEVPFNGQRQIAFPFRFDDGGFGAGIFVNTKEAGAPEPDGYVYVYGVRGKGKRLMVARVTPEDFEDFGAWRFWDGEGWSNDLNRVAYIASNVSNELSVSALPDGRYALVYQAGGMSSTVCLRLGETPCGPFGAETSVWECKEGQQKNIFTYNAKAHPHLSAPGELLISYNVNAFDFFNEIKARPNLYRPRFIKLKFHFDIF